MNTDSIAPQTPSGALCRLELLAALRQFAAMQTIALDEAKTRLVEIVSALAPGEEVTLVRGDNTTVRMRAEGSAESPRKSIFDHEPIHLGKRLLPYPHSDDDVLGEMIGDKFDRIAPKQ